MALILPLKIMTMNTTNTKIQARNTGVMMHRVATSTFRFPQAADHFKVKLTTDERQYVIINTSHSEPTEYFVTFKVTVTGVKLCSCTCADFANIKKHGRQCKHIHVAYNFHISRCKAKAAVGKAA